MKHHGNNGFLLLRILLIIFISISNVLANTGRRYLDFGAGYKTGDFGTATTSNLYYFSPAIGYIAPRYDVSVTVPYLSLTNKTLGQSQEENGIGDIILHAGSILIPESASKFSLYGALAIKLPTADETIGLGTGEADYGASLGVTHQIEDIKLSLTGGYINIGDPIGIDYNDIYLYGVGVSKEFGKTNITLSFDGRKSIIPDTSSPLELSIGFFHIMNKNYVIRGSTFKGLNNSGPDLGLDLGIVNWF